MSWSQEAEREFQRHACYNSFWQFFKYAYGYDYNPKGGGGNRPWLFEKTHRPACDWFEHHALEWLAARQAGRGLAKKLICVVPRDWGKTTLFAQAGQVWLHLHDQELASYTGCETVTRAREVLNGIKSVISGDDPYSRYAWLYGRQRAFKRKWKVDGVVTAARTNLTRRDDSYGIWAVQSGMVGLHPDAGFFDDPNTYERMDRHADWLDIVWNHMSTLIPVFQRDAFWMLTATRYGEGDHIGRACQRGGVRSMSGMPMPDTKVEGENGVWDVFYMDAIDEENNLTMPHIWDWDRIKQFERENSMRFWAQVRNRPTQNPDNILTRDVCERQIVRDDSVDSKLLRVSLMLDTAFKNPRRKNRGDYSVIAAGGHQPKTGKVFFLGAKVSKAWDSEEYVSQLIDSVVDYRKRCAMVSCLVDEQDIGGKPGVWEAYLKTKFRERAVEMPPLILLDRDSKRKELAIANTAGFWRNGKLRLLQSAANLEMLIDQMSKIGMSEYDDLADAFKDVWNHQIYQVVWASKVEDKETVKLSPFDEVLKPGRRGDDAAERIAELAARREREESEFYDVVQ
jgi:hypothetical protein